MTQDTRSRGWAKERHSFFPQQTEANFLLIYFFIFFYIKGTQQKILNGEFFVMNDGCEERKSFLFLIVISSSDHIIYAHLTKTRQGRGKTEKKRCQWNYNLLFSPQKHFRQEDFKWTYFHSHDNLILHRPSQQARNDKSDRKFVLAVFKISIISSRLQRFVWLDHLPLLANSKMIS